MVDSTEFYDIARDLGLTVKELAHRCGLTAGPKEVQCRKTYIMAAKYVQSRCTKDNDKSFYLITVPPEKKQWFEDTMEVLKIAFNKISV